MKANFCEKGDRITYALFIWFRTQKNKFDVVKMRGVVQKRRETLFVYSFIRFVGYLLIVFKLGTLTYHIRHIKETVQMQHQLTI